MSLDPVSPGLGGGWRGDHLRQQRVQQGHHLGVLGGQVVQLHRVLQHPSLLAVPGNHLDDVRGVHESSELVHQARGPTAVSHERAQEEIKLSALQDKFTHAGHEQIVSLAPLHLSQEVEVLQGLLGVGALEVFDVEHDQPRQVESLAAASVPGLLAEQRGLDVGGLVEEPQLEEDQGDVSGVTGEDLTGPEEEVQAGLELAGEKENLVVQHWLGTGREVRLACNERKVRKCRPLHIDIIIHWKL